MSEEILRRCAEMRDVGTGPISDAMEGMRLRRTVLTGWTFVSDDPGACLVGPAFTVRQVPKGRSVPYDENKARHAEAVSSLAQAGDVILVDNGGRTDIAVFGENLAMRAKSRGIAGFVVNGAVRDREWMRRLGFIVVSRGVSPVSSRWELETVGMNEPVIIDGVLIRPGDVIYADADGILILPKEQCLAIFDRAEEIKRGEANKQAELYGGKDSTRTAP